MTDHQRDMERLRHTLPVHPGTPAPLITGNLFIQTHRRCSVCPTVNHVCVCVSDFSPALASTHLTPAVNPLPAEIHARLALIKHTAEKVQKHTFTSAHKLPSSPVMTVSITEDCSKALHIKK